MNKAWFLLAFILLLAGCCNLLETKCTKTTDCKANELCQGGYCVEIPPCRDVGETCDTADDCCDEFLCEESLCVKKVCPNCNDGDECTTDTCDFSTQFECQHEDIVPCCGNDACEDNEDCEVCSADCGCEDGQLCEDGECISAYSTRKDEIFEEYDLDVCYDEIDTMWDYENYPEVRDKIVSCRAKIISYTADLRDLEDELPLTDEEKNNTEVAILYAKSHDQYWLYLYDMSYVIEKLYDDEYESDYEYVSELKGGLYELRDSLYYLYRIKEEYPSSWKEYLQEDFDSTANLYKGMNQRVNSAYDTFGSYDYKYALQVDPNDPFVIAKVDELTEGMGGDQDAMKLVLFEYVQENVEYKHDPAWQTDWVQPPVYTLMTGEGDCDDHAVALVSMMLRAGVDAQLCDAYVESYEYPDHLTVASGDYIYDATWDDPDPYHISEYPVYYVECYSPEEVQEYAYAPKCSDGTLYDYCSDYNIGSYCYNGELIEDCEYCGCPSDYPYCQTTGYGAGGCFTCGSGYVGYGDGGCCDIGYEYYGDGICCPPGYTAYESGACCLPGYYPVEDGGCCPDGTYYGGDGYCYDQFIFVQISPAPQQNVSGLIRRYLKLGLKALQV